MQPRTYHAMAVFQLALGLMEATMFGGSPKYDPSATTDQQIPKLSDTTVLRLGG